MILAYPIIVDAVQPQAPLLVEHVAESREDAEQILGIMIVDVAQSPLMEVRPHKHDTAIVVSVKVADEHHFVLTRQVLANFEGNDEIRAR